MTGYYFKTREFGISDAGIHLLRGGFNYRTINFSQISALRIERGKELHNWIVIFCIGAILLIIGVYLSLRAIDILMHGDIAPRNARMISLLFIPCIGAYFVYTSVQTGTIVRIDYERGKSAKFPLKEIIKEKRLHDFKSLMREKLSGKFKVTP